jgi:(1->4)-alpha-D-glucan 1-alpha-D-glucosylmutase
MSPRLHWSNPMAEAAYETDSATEALDALCRLHGIAGEYTDIWGNTQRASAGTRLALLKALDVLEDGADVEAVLHEQERAAWRRSVPPVAVFRVESTPYRLVFTLEQEHAQAIYTWSLVLESGEAHAGHFRPCELELLERHDSGDAPRVRVAFDWRDRLPLGYHTYSLRGPGLQEPSTVTIIVAPERCYLPPALEGGGRAWGAALQLYAVRSQRNWGMGDFTDLRSVVEQWGYRGAGVVGVNPLHALYLHNPQHASPYSPSSRLFLNVLYIDIEAMPDAHECADALAIMGSGYFQSALRAARGADLVDYAAIARLKLPVLERLHRHFREEHLARQSTRAHAFAAFQANGGRRLHQHALFEVLQEHFHREDPGVWGWPVWPEAYRRPDSDEVARFADEHTERIEFYEYLQWEAHVQLDRACTRANSMGLAVGLYQDLAISIDRGGAESWAHQDLYAVGASIGAPPDEVNLKGQNWGLPPLRPERLIEARYEPFIATLRANMRCAGALRIDHVMWLARLYWIPPDASPAEGAYVSYPIDDLLAIVALESERHGCMVIGEDLGTVPDEVRTGLARSGILSYRLLYFEKNESGEFKAPAEYPVDALVAASTHDLPTLTGFWEGHDLEVRQRLGLFPSDELRERYVVDRVQDRARLALALEREKLLPAEQSANPVAAAMTPEFALAVHAFLAHTPARLLVVQLEDVMGVREQANMPGTVDEQPNWRRRLPLRLEDLDQDVRFRALAETLARIRPVPTPVRRTAPPSGPRIPRCTYRLQLHREFTFTDATALVPYLAQLGVSHVYCSPYLRARPGSTHGYDIIDHNALNPEIGTTEDFERFVATLREHCMGHILDVVPNHMGVMGADNAWWLDVLENGPASTYAPFFDIDWHPANVALENKVLIPVLGDQYGLVLEGGELALRFHADTGELCVYYYDHRFPLNPRTYPTVLESATSFLHPGELPPQAAAELASLCASFGHLPLRDDTRPESLIERQRDKDVHKHQLARLVAEHPSLARAIEHAVRRLNGTPGEPSSFEPLHELLERQPYRLSSWRVAADEINYRRFFDINDLAALRMENEDVFEATHRFVLSLAAEGKIDGLRIDHPDGLYDPGQYFRRLQQRYAQLAGAELEPGDDERPARPLYVVIEKIAAGHERLPESWPIHGTSGYRFAAVVNGVLVDTTAAEEMERVYRGFVPHAPEYVETIYQGKRTIMQAALASPLTVLATELLRIAQADRRTRDYTLNNLRQALGEVVACFPVYRTYIVDSPAAQDRRYIEWAVAHARQRSRVADVTIFEFVRRMLLAETPEGAKPELAERIRAFAMKVQQFTSPVTAKGVEDTAFYRYNRLVSLNDVGGDPDVFGLTVSAFHGASAERAAHWPHTMLATSTHDNKRSEDVRARIDVLSEMPGEWRQLLRRWERMNRSKKTLLDERSAPSANEEYLLYQVLLGTFPASEQGTQELEAYCARIEAYMLKAAREAKVHTSWLNPNEAHENALASFVRALLTPSPRNLFLRDLAKQVGPLAWYGALNSLTMTLVKLASPGVPDIYQGNETCDLSLVDPDNRRPVDYGLRQRVLDELGRMAAAEDRAQLAAALARSCVDGRAKLWVVSRSLELRRTCPELFERGQYIPLHTHGPAADHVIAFMRRHGERAVIALAGRLWRKLGSEPGTVPGGEELWGETAVDSGGLSGPLVNVLTGERVRLEGERLRLAETFAHFPGALLVSPS